MEHRYVLDSIADDIRVDGRGRLAARDFSVRLNVNPQARGSAQVFLGSTCVLCFIYSDVTDRDADASRDGLSFSARVISSSDDVDAATIAAAARDLQGMYASGKLFKRSKAVPSLVERLFTTSGGGAADEQQQPAGGNDTVGDFRGGVGFKLVAEISVLSGTCGNILAAASLAVKSALWCASLPRVHITPAAAGSGGGGVEVDEQRRVSIGVLGVLMPVVVKAVATGTGFYCVDPCLEEETAAAFESVVAVQIHEAASRIVYTRTNGAASFASQFVRDRALGGVGAAEAAASQTRQMTVLDVTTIMTEAAAIAERLHESWSAKIA